MEPALEQLIALWNELGLATKVGLFAQAATCGLLIAAIHKKPSRVLCALALLAAILGFFGLSMVGIGNAEYVICGSLDAPAWCRGPER